MPARRAPALLPTLLLLIGPAAARGPDPAPDRPEPTEAERQEIRELAGRVTRGRHPAMRSSAAASLGAFGSKAELAVPALVSALGDRDSGVGAAAASALGKVGLHSREAVTGLVGALARGRDVTLQAAAAEGLGRIGPNAAAALPHLTTALASDDVDLRREAAAALGLLGARAKPAIPRLEPLLADGEPRVRLCAAIALVRLDDRSPQLVGALAAGVPRSSRLPVELRREACEALGLLGPMAASAVASLVGALEERPDINPALPYVAERQQAHDAMRRAAATALGRIGDRTALAPLERAAEAPALEEAAREALGRLEG